MDRYRRKSKNKALASTRNGNDHDYDPYTKDDAFTTSYNRYFSSSSVDLSKKPKQQHNRGASWNQRFNNGDFVPPRYGRRGTQKDAPTDELIQWAGTQHARQHFNRTKDQLGNWTNVFYKHGQVGC